MGLFSLFSKKPQESGDDLEMPVKPRRGRAAKPQEDEPVDPMLPEKKRARRRLVGATALVLAAIIGLPMIFDSEPKPLSDDIEIQIPSRDKIEAPALRPMPLPPEPAPVAPKSDAALERPAVLPAPNAKAAPDTAAKAPATVAKKPALAKAPPPKIHSAAHAAGKPAEKSVVKLSNKPVDKSADAGKGRFIVQVAAVSSHVKADDLQNRLKNAGIKSYSQKVSTKDGDRYRIRIGPFGSREVADRMRGRLALLGLSGTVQPL